MTFLHILLLPFYLWLASILWSLILFFGLGVLVFLSHILNTSSSSSKPTEKPSPIQEETLIRLEARKAKRK
nr:MAG TPA: Photosystem II protein D1 [Caudoviricetes sp.]